MPARPPSSGTALRPPAPSGAPGLRPPNAQTLVPPAPSKPVAPPPVFRKAPPLPPNVNSSAGSNASRLLPKAPAAAPAAPAVAPANLPSTTGPKKETARIALLPDPPARPAHTVEMKKTQPLSMMPDPVPPVMPIAHAPVTIAPLVSGESFIDDIPMPLCWGLLAAAIVILTIQIWNYLS